MKHKYNSLLLTRENAQDSVNAGWCRAAQRVTETPFDRRARTGSVPQNFRGTVVFSHLLHLNNGEKIREILHNPRK